MLLAFVAAACAACASQSVTLTATVSQGRSLELLLRNGSAQPIGYNLCASSLERRSGDGWQPVASQRLCTMEVRSLPPGGEARYQLPMVDVPPGEYRATTRIDVTPAEVTTEPFRLR